MKKVFQISKLSTAAMDSPTASSGNVGRLRVEDQQNQCEWALGAWSAGDHGWAPLEHHQEKQPTSLRGNSEGKAKVQVEWPSSHETGVTKYSLLVHKLVLYMEGKQRLKTETNG